MNYCRLLNGLSVTVLLLGAAAALEAGEAVPFKATWSGATVSAEPTDDPDVVFVTTAGTGRGTHLGKFTMVSPHLSHLLTFEVEGMHIFTAANGDELIGEFSGQFTPTPDGFLVASLPSTIVGGTGRFEGATGEYDFSIIFNLATFESTATIQGTISRP